MSRERSPWRRRLGLAAASALGLALVNWAPVAWGSILGEENLTLVQILAQATETTDELRDLNDGMAITAGVVTDLRDTYASVNAGIDELRGYSFDHFLDDLHDDLYRTYPGFERLEHASSNLRFWEDTHARSPWTAYEAIGAAAGDFHDHVLADARAGHVNLDRALIRRGEAAGGLALAASAEEATRAFDRDVAELARFAGEASPGQSEQLTARALVLVAAQNSHMIRLLSRGVRLEGVGLALDYADQVDQVNAGYQDRYDPTPFVNEALRPAPMVDFTELE